MTNQKNEPHIEDTPKDTQDELAISWEEALAEQAQGSPDESHDGDQAESAPDDADNIFQPLEQKHAVSQSDIDMNMDIQVQISVEMDRTGLNINNMLQLIQVSAIELDAL